MNYVSKNLIKRSEFNDVVDIGKFVEIRSKFYTYDIHWYIPETVNSPFSLRACSINSVYVNGGFLALS